MLGERFHQDPPDLGELQLVVQTHFACHNGRNSNLVSSVTAAVLKEFLGSLHWPFERKKNARSLWWVSRFLSSELFNKIWRGRRAAVSQGAPGTSDLEERLSGRSQTEHICLTGTASQITDVIWRCNYGFNTDTKLYSINMTLTKC